MIDNVDKSLAWDVVVSTRLDERERCAKIAEQFSDQGRDGHQIAKAIRAGKRPPQVMEGPRREV